MSSDEKKVQKPVEGASKINSSVQVSCPKKSSFKPVICIAKKQTVIAGGKAVERVKVTCKVDGSKFEGKGALVWPDDTVALYSHATNKETPFGKNDRLTAKMLASGATLHLQPLKAGVATVTLSLEETGDATVDNSEAKQSVTIEEATLAITHSDGESPPAPTLLVGNVRKFNAVGTPKNANRKFEWTMSGGETHAEVTAGSAKGKAAGNATIKVTMTVSGSLGSGIVTKEHPLKVVDVKIRDGDGKSDAGTSILRGTKRTYKAVVDPEDAKGTFKWQGVKGKLTIAKEKEQTVEVTGLAESAGNELKLRYELDNQFVEPKVTIAVTELKVTPRVVAVKVDRKNGSKIELVVKGAPDEINLAWSLADNTFKAAFDGDTKKPKVVVTANTSGAVAATVTYKSDTIERNTTGGAVFVDAFLASLKAESANSVSLNSDSKDKDKKVSVLLGLESDPPQWTLGFVTAALSATPEKVDLCEVKATGSCAWEMPDDDSFMRVANKQAKDHGADKTKVLLRALPKSDDSGLTDASVTEKVTAEYTLLDVKAADELSVVIRRDGCSGVKWLRRGGYAVTEQDQPVICAHGEQAQCKSIKDAVEISGDPPSNGHQHGGLCVVCSTVEDPPPRKIWHYVDGHSEVLKVARDLSNAILNSIWYNKREKQFEAFLTKNLNAALWNDDEKLYKSRMLGVLRGINDKGEKVWRYALSGAWKADGPWSPPLSFNSDVFRTIPSFAGSAATYQKGSAPFDTNAMAEGFGKLGRCAAPVLLAAAITQKLTNVELAEVWVDLAQYPSKQLPFVHNYEIGSCAICRTILGRMVCEVGN